MSAPIINMVSNKENNLIYYAVQIKKSSKYHKRLMGVQLLCSIPDPTNNNDRIILKENPLSLYK